MAAGPGRVPASAGGAPAGEAGRGPRRAAPLGREPGVPAERDRVRLGNARPQAVALPRGGGGGRRVCAAHALDLARPDRDAARTRRRAAEPAPGPAGDHAAEGLDVHGLRGRGRRPTRHGGRRPAVSHVRRPGPPRPPPGGRRHPHPAGEEGERALGRGGAVEPVAEAVPAPGDPRRGRRAGAGGGELPRRRGGPAPATGTRPGTARTSGRGADQSNGRRDRRLFPCCPQSRTEAIAAHTAVRGSGRVGRSAAGRALDEAAITAAVVASVRHEDTPYDELLMSGEAREAARAAVRADVDTVLARWRDERPTGP
ncbi:DUF2293 domain-containing protein [Pseudonocardia nigra]|uniref:DUF2293 domain-containing protein n=1 Tax=Pseudonocardia nigra TaxID=1921578 RepID=UPI0027E37C00|nr:DUF2293 domain-containing protein [Pseudonocardia nigra]